MREECFSMKWFLFLTQNFFLFFFLSGELWDPILDFPSIVVAVVVWLGFFRFCFFRPIWSHDLGFNPVIFTLNFWPMFQFYTPWKHLSVFREYKMGTLTRYGLKPINWFVMQNNLLTLIRTLSSKWSVQGKKVYIF